MGYCLSAAALLWMVLCSGLKAQCVFSDLPCPPTPPACPASGCGGNTQHHPAGGGTVVHDAYYERITAYNNLTTQAWNANHSGNYTLALQVYLQAQQKDDTKYVRSEIQRTRGHLAFAARDWRGALAYYEASEKLCKSCWRNDGYISRLQDYVSKLDAAVAAQHNQQVAAQQQAAANNAAAVSSGRASVDAMKQRVNARLAGLADSVSALPSDRETKARQLADGSAPSPGLSSQKAAVGQLATSGAFGIQANPDNPDIGPGRSTATEGSDKNPIHQANSGAASGRQATGSSSPEGAIGAASEGFDSAGVKTKQPDPNYGTRSLLDTLSPEKRAKVLNDPHYIEQEQKKQEALKQLPGEQQKLRDLETKLGSVSGDEKQKLLIDYSNQKQVVDRTAGAITSANAQEQSIVQEYNGAPIIKKKQVVVPPPATPDSYKQVPQ
ncbi:MAG: hypothetical protein ABSD59_24390 [Terracidiphilus sp.]